MMLETTKYARTPNVTPDRSMRTSVSCPERPGTKSCRVSSATGTSATRSPAGSGRTSLSLRRALRRPQARMPRTAYSEKCAAFLTTRVMRSRLLMPTASNRGLMIETTKPLSSEDCGPWMRECPKMKATQHDNATAHLRVDRRAESWLRLSITPPPPAGPRSAWGCSRRARRRCRQACERTACRPRGRAGSDGSDGAPPWRSSWRTRPR